jgi:DNA-binding NarL/FixJ family response regulator
LKGLVEELSANGYNVVGSANNGTQALEQVMSLSPTIALLDIDMPILSGFEVVKTAKAKGSTVKFIMFSYHKESEFVVQAKSLQIDGYLLKEDSFSEIEKCIDMVINGGEFFSTAFSSNALKNASEEMGRLKWLTASELTILKFIAERETNGQIAEKLSVSIRTIEKHRSNIIAKLWKEKGGNSLSSWAIINKSLILNH